MSTSVTIRSKARDVTRWAAITAIVLVVSACGGDDTEGTPPATQQPPAGDQAEGTEVIATETEFRIELSRQEFEPGTYTFVARNEGEITHALAIEGEGLKEDTDTIGGGESTELTVTLEAGTYEIWCPVGNHRDLGMTTEITVGDAESPAEEDEAPSPDGSGY